MRKSMYYMKENLPLAFGAMEISEILGISRASAYVLMRQPDFPAFTVGKRWIVSRERFFEWLDGGKEKAAG